MVVSILKAAFKKKVNTKPYLKATEHVYFPEIILKVWLKNRKQWDHSDWLNLLDDLRQRGYGKFTDCEEGRAKIGQFLEAEREAI